MSDKNRNMNDINDQKTAEQQAFSEEIRRRLAEPGSGKPTLDEFKVMVYKDREKRRKKRNALVACIVAAFIVGFLSFDALVPEVGADKNPKEEIVTEGNIIVENEGWSSEGEDDNTWITNDWNQVKDAENVIPELMLPKYIPAGYNFKKLKIEELEVGYWLCEYHFYEEKTIEHLEIELYYHDADRNSLEISNVSRKIESNKGMIYIQEEEKKATTQTDSGVIITVWSELSDRELIKLVNLLQ